MVPRRRLELPRSCNRQHLKLVRLPISPSGQQGQIIAASNGDGEPRPTRINMRVDGTVSKRVPLGAKHQVRCAVGAGKANFGRALDFLQPLQLDMRVPVTLGLSEAF